MSKRHLIKVGILVLGDAIFLYGALFAGLWLRYAPEYQKLAISLHNLPFVWVFGVWLVFFGAFGLYDLKLAKPDKLFVYRLLRAMTANLLAAVVIFYFVPYFGIEPRRNLLIITVLSFMFLVLWRYIFNLVVVRTPGARLLFLGATREIISLADWLLKNPQLGQKPVGFVSNGSNNPFPLPLPHFSLSAQKLPHIAEDTRANTVVISRELKEDRNLTKILFQMIPRGITVMEFTRLHEMLTGKIPLSLIGELWFVENLVGIKKGTYEFFKRLADLLLALFCAVPAALTLPLIAITIKIDSEGPVFYTQRRVGRHGRTFRLIKYRSMVKDAEKMGGLKRDNGNGDLRLTRVGSFLRKSYLDELPQIINVFKGEMSFVGPRPERPEFVETLKEKIPFYEMRLLVPPGLTGWAQINMEDDASVEDAPEKVQYDLYYIKNHSFILDLLIILRTISALLRRQGR